MGRKHTILQSEFPYNLSGRCINKEWFNLPLEEVWNIFSEELYLVWQMYNLQIHSFVLMNNHYHLIASTPDSNLSQCMHALIGTVSKRLNKQGNRLNGNFSGRYFKTILHHHNFFLNAYKYNYRNPVACGICTRAEDYPFSTLSGLLGQNKLLIPVAEDVTLFGDLSETLKWLNIEPNPTHQEAVRYALKRPYFKSKKCRSTRREMIGKDDIL